MSVPIDNYCLIKFMLEEGLVPDECVDIEISFPIASLVQVHYVVNLTDDRLRRFYRAFGRLLEDMDRDKSQRTFPAVSDK